MMTNPFFSILTVTKNNVCGLGCTKKSITAQHFQNFEWLIQDGGSDDGTVEAYQNENIETAPDRGIYDAMNRLIERANGQYLLFLNAGDALADETILQHIYDTAKNAAPDFIYGDAIEDGHIKKARSRSKLTQGMVTHHQAMLYRRDTVGHLRYDEHYKIAADYDFTARFLHRHCERSEAIQHRDWIASPAARNDVIYIRKPICIFESGGVSQQNAALGRREQYQIRERLRLCNPLTNITITAMQILNWRLRRALPALYWFSKRR